MRNPLSLVSVEAAARAIRARTCDLLVSTRGIAAVEFALVLPFMLLLYFGMAELTVGLSIDRKLTLLSRSLADLTGRASTLASGDFDNIFSAVSAVVAPYPVADAQMRISEVVVTGSSGQVQGKICWSKGRGFPDLATGTAYAPLPAGYDTPGAFFIVAEVKMPYQPMFGAAITNTITLSQTTPWPIRNVGQVTYSGFKTFKDTEMGRSATGTC